MYAQYQTTNQFINNNPRIHGKVMSISQLETLIRLTCKYDYCMPIKALTVIQASAEITEAMNAVAQGNVKERKHMYTFDFMMKRFIANYPEIYTEVINR